VGGGPIPDPGASRDTPRPPYDIASFRQDAPEASGPQLAAWRRPTFCESTLFSRSSVWGMAAFRHTFQQAVLPLLAEDGPPATRTDRSKATFRAPEPPVANPDSIRDHAGK